MSGSPRGDCAYIGQLEDDLVDLIQRMQLQNKKIFLLGHSSGGGLAIRFAGGNHNIPIHGYVLFLPLFQELQLCGKEQLEDGQIYTCLNFCFVCFLIRLG